MLRSDLLHIANKPLLGDSISPFQCPICFDFYDKSHCVPVSFLCGHTCCMRDAKKLDQCHLCRCAIPMTEQLVPNYALRDGAILMRDHIEKKFDRRIIIQKPLSHPRSIVIAESVILPIGFQRDIIYRGNLRVRSDKKSWKLYHFILTEVSLLQLDVMEDNNIKNHNIIGEYVLHPNFTINKINDYGYAFNIIMYRHIVHLSSQYLDEAHEWVKYLRHVTNTSTQSLYDLLTDTYKYNNKIIPFQPIESDYYNIILTKYERTGIYLEKRTGEAAVVKCCTMKNLNIYINSALVAIDSIDATDQSFQESMKLIRSWRPENTLTLRFLRSPKKTGIIWKKEEIGQSFSSWDISLLDGTVYLISKNIYKPHSMKTSLIGSVVSLISNSDIGGNNCIRILNDELHIILKTETDKDMLEWSFALYTAAALANGSINQYYHLLHDINCSKIEK